jgi:mono/diheme cytochrome c family protein
MRLPLLVLAAGILAGQQPDKIWDGVFTAAQAQRGKASFDKECSNCHNQDLNGSARAPGLRGDRFLGNWLNGSVNALYSKIRFSMPATYPETVSDAVKLDILTYLLEVNGFPAGSAELKMDADELERIQIVRKGAREVPNFVLVRVVGCLEPGPKNTWVLTKTSEPIAIREDTPADSQNASLGAQTFVLVSAAQFQPESHRGEKMEARGLLYREPAENRLNLTALQRVAASCSN